MKGLLDPKVDFVFKNIFGSPKHPRVLISFLNATLKPVNKITHVEIKETDIAKQFVRSLEMNVEEIREAKDELVRISNDKEQREIYEMRSKILKDKVSALNEAERKGIEKGIKQGIEKGIKQRTVELAENLLDVLDNETISLKTGLTVDEIEQLRHK